MTISKTETGQTAAIAVAGEADLRDGAELRTALLDALDSRHATVLDVSRVERADLALLQLICSAVGTFQAEGIPLTLRDGGTRGPFRHALCAAGFPPLQAEEIPAEETT